MSLALAGVLVAPRRARWAAAVIGSGLALAVGASVVAVGWHYPSDVIAGYLLATGWALTIAAALYEAERRYPAGERWAGTALARASDRIADRRARAGGSRRGGRRACWPPPACCSRTPSAASCFARENTAFVVVAGGVASAALALPVTMAGVARRG